MWLPEIGARGWVVLTKDKRIRKNPREREKVIATNLRLFTLSGGSMTGDEMCDTYLKNMPKIGRFLKKNPPPFIVLVSSSGLSYVPLEPPSPGEEGTEEP